MTKDAGGEAEAVLAELARASTDYDRLAAQLQWDGAADFVTSWNDLLASIASKAAVLMQARQAAAG